MSKEISLDEIQGKITKECEGIKKLLLDKNKKYGNSAIQPKRIFSGQDSVEQIKVRIDDKLSRIQNATMSGKNIDEDEDVIQDLIGYLILLRISQSIKD